MQLPAVVQLQSVARVISPLVSLQQQQEGDATEHRENGHQPLEERVIELTDGGLQLWVREANSSTLRTNSIPISETFVMCIEPESMGSGSRSSFVLE